MCRWRAIVLLSVVAVVIGNLPAAEQATAPRPLAASKSLVWEVRREPKPGRLYLAGSLHQLRARDRPPSALFDAYAYCDRVVFEVNLAELEQPEFRREVTRQARLPEGQSLFQLVDPDTADRLRRLARAHQLPEDEFARFRPWFASNYAALLMLSAAGFEEAHGVDRWLFDRAVRERKAREYLETGAQQLEILQSLPEHEVIELMKWDLQSGVGKARRLAEAWKAGNADALARLTALDQTVAPQSIERLLTKRNAAWAPRLEQWLADTNCTLVVVGAAHLAGANGLVRLLEQRGYQVKQMP